MGPDVNRPEKQKGFSGPMTTGISPVARRVFDGTDWHHNAALSHAEGKVIGLRMRIAGSPTCAVM